MKLNSKCFLLAALMVMGFVSGASAAVKPIAFSCYHDVPEFGPDNPENNQFGPYICKIGQFDNVEEAVAHNYSTSNVYDSWSAFVTQLNSSLEAGAQECETAGPLCTDFSIDFETSIAFISTALP